MTRILLTMMLNPYSINLNQYNNNLNPLFLIISGKKISLTTFWTNLGPYDIFHLII